MSNLTTQSTFQYENNWLRLYEAIGEKRILVKEQKLNFKTADTAWQREEELIALFDHIALLSPIETSSKNTRKYTLPAGQPLIQVIEEGKTTLEERMKIAEQLIEIVSSFHHKQLYFSDLTWYLFWYDLLEERLYLLDTSMTLDLSAASKHHRIGDIEADMYCIAPEQVMSSSYVADFRSNFYALGVILYALFTTKKPFEGIERLSLLHKHKVHIPLPPIDYENKLGHDLSNFIFKLLAKTPDERYQSSKGLVWDFRQLRTNFELGNTDIEFQLGTHDFAQHFFIPDHLFFREEEHQLLIEQAQKAVLGNKSLLLIKGQKGAGIAKIMDDFLDALNPLDYYLAKGAYSAESKLPYSDIRTLTSDLLDQVLRQDHETLTQIKENLAQNIGNLSGVLIDFNENFEALFSSNQAYQELSGTAALNRLSYAYLEFLRTLEQRGKSIILCIDQMHLSNYNSLALVERLLASSVLDNLLVVVGFDENQATWSPYFTQFYQNIKVTLANTQVLVQQIQLSNFSSSNLKQRLKTLKIEPLEELHDFLYKKTNGNAGFVKQLLEEINSKNLIHLASNQQAWQVHMPSIKDIDLSGNINEFLSKKIQRLSAEELSLLKVAAMIGQQFQVSQLQSITQWNSKKVLTIIDRLREGDFIVPVSYKQAKLYELQFAHPSFLALIQKTIFPKEYETIKLQLAKDVLERINTQKEDIRLYELMSHLLVLPAEACKPYQEWILQAAVKAKKETAFEFAQKYFEKLVEIGSLSSNDKSAVFEYAYEACSCTLFAMDYV
ncbi:MAG: AAA family ATPase, partial [Bacteroidota bacterium]